MDHLHKDPGTPGNNRQGDAITYVDWSTLERGAAQAVSDAHTIRDLGRRRCTPNPVQRDKTLTQALLTDFNLHRILTRLKVAVESVGRVLLSGTKQTCRMHLISLTCWLGTSDTGRSYLGRARASPGHFPSKPYAVHCTKYVPLCVCNNTCIQSMSMFSPCIVLFLRLGSQRHLLQVSPMGGRADSEVQGGDDRGVGWDT